MPATAEISMHFQLKWTSIVLAGSESDWVLDLVATGFDKPSDMFGHSLRTTEDVKAAANAFREHYIQVHFITVPIPRALITLQRGRVPDWPL